LQQNEVYYLVKDALLVDVCSILGHCIIRPKGTKAKKTSKSSKKVTEYKIEASYDPVTGIYYPINWNDFHSDKMTVRETDRVAIWNVAVDSSSRKRGHAQESDDSSDESSSEELALEPISEEESDDGTASADDDLDALEPPVSDSETEANRSTVSPTKKRKRKQDDTVGQTPVKKRKGTVQPTPHSKAALRARKKFKIRPPSDLGQDNTTLYTMEDDPFLRAMHTLHVGERPDSLPCRDEEYVNIFENVIGLLQEASGGCICEYFYIFTSLC